MRLLGISSFVVSDKSSTSLSLLGDAGDRHPDVDLPLLRLHLHHAILVRNHLRRINDRFDDLLPLEPPANRRQIGADAFPLALKPMALDAPGLGEDQPAAFRTPPSVVLRQVGNLLESVFRLGRIGLGQLRRGGRGKFLAIPLLVKGDRLGDVPARFVVGLCPRVQKTRRGQPAVVSQLDGRLDHGPEPVGVVRLTVELGQVPPRHNCWVVSSANGSVRMSIGQSSATGLAAIARAIDSRRSGYCSYNRRKLARAERERLLPSDAIAGGDQVLFSRRGLAPARLRRDPR